MAVYQSTHTGSQIDSGVTKGLLVPTPSSVSDAGKVIAVNQSGNGYELQTQSGGMTNPMTTQGDIIVGGASGAPTRLAKGTDGQFLSSTNSTLQWADAVSFALIDIFKIWDSGFTSFQSYYAEEGTLWSDWINSELNWSGYRIVDNKVVTSDGTKYVSSFGAVSPSDTIGPEDYFLTAL